MTERTRGDTGAVSATADMVGPPKQLAGGDYRLRSEAGRVYLESPNNFSQAQYPMAFQFNFHWRFLRPLPSLHWAVPCMFVASLVMATAGHQCRVGPNYEGPIWLTAMTMTSFWVAVYSTAAAYHGWRRWMKVGSRVLFDVLCVSLLALPFMLLQPTYQCYTERAKVAEMIVVASPYREAIADRATQQHSLSGVGRGLLVEPTGQVHGGTISANGVITLFSEEPRALVVLRPYFENSELKWACEGFPRTAMPAQCRNLPYQMPEEPRAN